MSETASAQGLEILDDETSFDNVAARSIDLSSDRDDKPTAQNKRKSSLIDIFRRSSTLDIWDISQQTTCYDLQIGINQKNNLMEKFSPSASRVLLKV